MRKPLLLDLFCGAGGAAMGYHRAGFEVVGVDVDPQPNYPFLFVQDDALRFVLRNGHHFDAVHASPPCQRYCAPSQYNRNRESYPDLVPHTRLALIANDRPFVIENTPGAPLQRPIVLCGTMFHLRVYRHRLFELRIPQVAPLHPRHVARCARNGVLPRPEQFLTVTGGKHSKAWVRAAAEAMGVEWMHTVREVCEAIPPAYTEYIGRGLMAQLQLRRAA